MQEAIAALDAGECVLIFPEGSLRKIEERPLRHFGQGVWHILQRTAANAGRRLLDRGRLGQLFFLLEGPPTKNKRMDFWRHIDIAVGEAHCLDAGDVG